MLKPVLWVAIGGALGSILRYLMSRAIQENFGIDFPIGTLFVNLLGSFVIGFLYSYMVEGMLVAPHIRVFAITGILGGFTTFSSFSYESLQLLMEGNYLGFLIYFCTTNFGGIFLTFLGYNLGRML